MSKEKEQDKEKIKLSVYLDNMFYEDEINEHYTKDKETLKRRLELIKEHILTLTTWKEDNTSKLFYEKQAIIKCNNLLDKLVYAYDEDNIDQLDEARLNECIRDYNKINDFFKDENAFKIVDIYGNYAITSKSDNGFYNINDIIANKVIEENDLNIDINREDYKNVIEDVKEAILDTWENKKEIITPSDLNTLSEEHNGINFKQFLFCEEYIKRGKIKPTCDYLGISRNTAYLWLKDDKVNQYLKKRQDEIKRETDDTFIHTYRASFNELNKMIESNYIENNDKIKAIDIFLKHYENIERLKQPVATKED